ncbi:hypothetical protein [Nitrosopumilus sp.]|uniref:hypothetical protein n=1 Tax=Nitrosopumilus sp. TaxID=2024843 RepID=UPI00247CF750|nr:hypothetical protein [Nitrosopumilus sp.]MCV0431688.1 hypothetical protein [Nitrosopumilus sp.]
MTNHPIIFMNEMAKKVTIVLDDDLVKKLRVIQSDMIIKLQKPVPFSKLIVYMLRKALTPKLP